jgi:hypothetical protein
VKVGYLIKDFLLLNIYILMIGCGRNFHKRCVSDLPDNCSPMARKISDVACSNDDDVNNLFFSEL